MALLRRTRDEAQDRPHRATAGRATDGRPTTGRPTTGRHRGSRKARRERVPAGGRHVRIMLEPAQPSGPR